jgi:ABC-type proline/glycine betaine transport system substrate-binding protein
MVFIKESNKSTLEAAREWMNAHEDVVIPWIPAK